MLVLGSTGKGSSNLDSSGQITGTTVTFNGLPNNGESLYVRLYTYYGTACAYTDYTYTAEQVHKGSSDGPRAAGLPRVLMREFGGRRLKKRSGRIVACSSALSE